MAITESIEIDRPPQDVFAYATDAARVTEWQEKLTEVKMETEGPTRVGSRMKQTRRVGGGTRTFTVEVTGYEAPSRMSFQGIDGPIRPRGNFTVSPVDDGQRSRFTLELDFEGRGLGVLFAPLVRWDAGRQVKRNLQRLKEKLESS